MPAMIGRLTRGPRHGCPCCSDYDRRTVQAREERRWRAEAENELEEHQDQYWLFLEP